MQFGAARLRLVVSKLFPIYIITQYRSIFYAICYGLLKICFKKHVGMKAKEKVKADHHSYAQISFSIFIVFKNL